MRVGGKEGVRDRGMVGRMEGWIVGMRGEEGR